MSFLHQQMFRSGDSGVVSVLYLQSTKSDPPAAGNRPDALLVTINRSHALHGHSNFFFGNLILTYET